MIKIHEAIVVEGRYDKNTLSQLVDAPIFETSGFAIINDKEQLELLRYIARLRGLIVFTDSDGAGFVIRNFLKGAIPSEYLKHAYIPDIQGKERRKATPGKEGKLGVEGMTPDIIIASLRRAGATVEGETATKMPLSITKTDMFLVGLSGIPGSEEKRNKLKKALELPEHLSSNGLLQVLNLMYTKEEFLEKVQQIF